MKKTVTFFLLMTIASILSANNITIGNLSLTGKNTSLHYTMVQFDVSWANSWRTSTNESNWDAAWVFVKYRVAVASGGDGEWHHASLNDAGHTAPTGSTITPGLLDPGSAFNAVTNPGLGAFIYRSADGAASTFTNTGVQLRWNYGVNYKTGTTPIGDADLVELKVFAIEMVYVPQGAFKVGSGGTENDAFYKYPTTTNAFQVTSENAINVGTTADYLYYPANFNGGDWGGPIPAAFPKGYAGFYCQKYEISQQQYVDFLNTLTQTQADNRKYTGTSNRYAITGSAVGSYATTNPNVSCNYLTWMDGAAYSDWAGLRPMTEMEYEKACRGTATPVANEYTWGTASVAGNAYTLSNGSAADEGIATNYSITTGNASYYTTGGGIDGPLRVGIFAANGSNAGRITAGASYYGIMELSGNLWERAVTVGKATGRAFTGLHGNGVLSTAGHADVTAWPGLTSGEVTDADGSGFRGGGWGNEAAYMRISDRHEAAYTYTGRYDYSGFRAVRTQPFVCGISTFAVNHVTSGGVAPVNKSVTYGTVSTTLFGGNKCAITRNLGAASQAGSASDATEASAGWYWQFNRKQGWEYKTSLVPVSPPAWEATMDNSSATWEAAKDPCTIELGTSWRIPTNTEWTTADALWNNYDDTYGSVLKLHAAGYLSTSDGSLINRGSVGFYWSSTQYDDTYGWNYYGWSLGLFSSYSDMSYGSKAFGYSVRCLKDLLPTLTTTTVTSITKTTASSGGNVTDDGGSAITARGVCWSTSTNPIATGSHTTETGTTGVFTSNLTSLTAGTLYYVRAYATSSSGTAYGNEVSFSTISCFIAGTKITMADGTLKNIEEIKVGEKVKSVKTETMEVVVETVEKTFANPPSTDLTKITFSNGQTNTNTRVHPYWVVGKGWSCVDRVAFKNVKGFSADPLTVGNQCLIEENGKLVQVTITNIEDQIQLTLPTFNFTVSQTNCYFANGVLVHNKPSGF